MRGLWVLPVLLTAACGGGSAGLVGSGPTSTPAADGPVDTVAEACPELAAAHLGEAPAGVTAYVCPTDTRPLSGQGVHQYALVQQVTGGLDALLQAYAAEDAGSTGSCPAIARDPRVVWLHDGTMCSCTEMSALSVASLPGVS